jgi:alpha-galactosidase
MELKTNQLANIVKYEKGTLQLVGNEKEWLTSNGIIEIRCDLQLGTTDYRWMGSSKAELIHAQAYAMVDGTLWSSLHAQRHYGNQELKELSDDFGKGLAFEIIHEFKESSTQLVQQFSLYEFIPYVMVKVIVQSDREVSVNRLSPLSIEERQEGSLKLSSTDSTISDDLVTLFVPFDNDKWVRYGAYELAKNQESYGVGAIFDPKDHRGIIMGSLTHDQWKTGIVAQGKGRHVNYLDLYGGAASDFTRDSIPHGALLGKEICSPLCFIGYYDDIRSGLEQYGQANIKLIPALPWKEGVPFGWNSWSAAGDKVDANLYMATSDFFKESLQSNHFHNEGIVYINFDSFWDNLTLEELESAVKHVLNNGQKAGIYWTPFTFWGQGWDQYVEGTNNQFKYHDLLLKDHDGHILPELDGGLSLDPTHPGTLQRIDWQMKRFVKWGFEYVKFDFMGHAALEGKHYEPQITTGMAAYNYGMNYLTEQLRPERIGRPFFINFSIAPLFPHAYAHSRRVSCDVFATIEDTAYLLNALNFGWWINQTLYRFNDPDHTVLYKSYNQEPTTFNEARSRLHASIIGGTVMLAGDDFRLPEARERAHKLLTNERVNAVALLGRAFLPIEMNIGDQSCEEFFLVDETENTVYFAIFNLQQEKRVKKISIGRIGWKEGVPCQAEDLWSGVIQNASDSLEVLLEGMDSTILRLTKVE